MKFDRLIVLALGDDRQLYIEGEGFLPYPLRAKDFYGEKKFWGLTYKLILPGVLTPYTLTEKDKLMIFAHGDPGTVCGANKQHYSPELLVSRLADWGLRRIGLISFKACNIGASNYLENFLEACTMKNIEVGWLKGYRGFAATVSSSKPGKPYHQKIKTIDQSNDPKDVLHGDARYKVVQGNIIVTVDGSERFTPR